MKKDQIKDILNGVISAFQAEAREEAESQPLYNFILSQSDWLRDPGHTYLFLYRKIDNIIEACVQKMLNSSDWLVQEIYKHQSFFEQHIETLCNNLYGLGCCHDKSKFLLKSAISWRLTGKLPILDPKPKNYHHPESGTAEQWMNLVEGLGYLYHGKPKKYLKAYKELISLKAMEV